MRKPLLALLVLFLAAPLASATETVPADAAAPELAPTVTVETPVDAELDLEEIQLEERAAADESADAAQFPARGSFWWLVGVVVVAGVILAIVL